MTFKIDPTVAFYLEHRKKIEKWSLIKHNLVDGHSNQDTAFYSENRKQIEEWANIRNKTSTQALEFVYSLEAPLVELAATLHGRPQARLFEPGEIDDGLYLCLFGRHWCASDGKIVVGVGIWNRPEHAEFAALGVYVEIPHGPYRDHELVDWIDDHGESDEEEVPLLETVPSDFWNHMEKLENEIFQRFKSQWKHYQPVIDRYYDEKQKNK